MKIFNISKTLRSYLVIGLSVYGIEIITILVAQKLGASSIVAVALSFWVGLMCSFFLQKILTFKDRRFHKKILSIQLLMTTLLVAFNFGFTLLVTKLLQKYFPAILLRTLALGCTTIWNFYLYKTTIFGKDKIIID